MSTYTRSDFAQIAAAIGISAEQLANHETKFETTALWFRLDKGRPRRAAPSKRRERLNQVAKSARRLLKSLGINDPAEAADGPGDREIFEALVLVGEQTSGDPTIRGCVAKPGAHDPE